MVYDAENRQISYTKSSTTAYGYDGDGHRVTKTAGGTTTVFVCDVGGQLIAEYGGPAANGGTRYLIPDHLSSTRVVTDANKAVIARHDYLPFGEEIPSGIGNRTPGVGYVTADDTRQRFTSKERDLESGLDYFRARYFSSPQGRFCSVDPSNAGAGAADPQSWNAYIYGRDNPLKYVDPDGLKVRIYDEYGNWVDLSDEEAKNSIFNKKYQQSLGNTVKNGRITDANGKVIGTYTRISFERSS